MENERETLKRHNETWKMNKNYIVKHKIFEYIENVTDSWQYCANN